MSLQDLKAALSGSWVSIAPEVRPSKNQDGTIKPFFLTRNFVYQPSDRFELTVVNYGDAYGAVPVAKIDIAGHMSWRGEHPIAPGAQKVDFSADATYAVTPLVQPFADLLNKVATDEYARWDSARGKRSSASRSRHLGWSRVSISKNTISSTSPATCSSGAPVTWMDADSIPRRIGRTISRSP